MQAFNLSTGQTTHHEEDRFDSPDDVALAFGLMFEDKSIREKQEYGAIIVCDLNNNKPKYFYANMTNSSEYSGKHLNELSDGERINVGVDLNYINDEGKFILYSHIHTHWTTDGLNFSSWDKNNDFPSARRLRSSYLVNSKFQFKRSDRSTDGYTFTKEKLIFEK